MSLRTATTGNGEPLHPAPAEERATNVTGDLAPNLALPWVVRLRYGMVAGETAIVLGIAYGAGFDPALRWTLLPLATILASNVLLARLRSLPDRFSQETLGGTF